MPLSRNERFPENLVLGKKELKPGDHYK